MACSSAGVWEQPSSTARTFPQPHAQHSALTEQLDRDGCADMGQGAWTALAQIGAEALGLDPSKVESTSVCPACPMAASPRALATRPARACRCTVRARTRFPDRRTSPLRILPSPLFGAGNIGVVARDGRLYRSDDDKRGESYADILARAGRSEIVGTAKAMRDPAIGEKHALFSHGAVFAEVKVDPDLGQVRVPVWSAPLLPAGSSTRVWFAASITVA